MYIIILINFKNKKFVMINIRGLIKFFSNISYNIYIKFIFIFTKLIYFILNGKLFSI